MKRIETTINRKQLKMTALAFAAAQVALLCGNAYAETGADEPAAKEGANVVVVTGQRKQYEAAADIKRNSDLIVDSVVADEAGKLPDKSITEVLQRVVGVTMDRNRTRTGANLAANGLGFDVEGSGIQVRGLSWGSSTLNGRETFSAGWPGRELSWGDVPPELMAGVDVYKNPSAELIEGGISGQVNLRTRLPFDAKGQFGALSMSENYAVLGKTKSPAFSGLYSNRWKTDDLGEFGVLVDLSYNKNTSRYDSIDQSVYYPRSDLVKGKTVWVPVGASWGTTNGDTERKGFYGALQWKKNGKETSLTYFDSGFHSMNFGNNIFLGGEFPYYTHYDNAKYDERGVFQSGVLSYPVGGRGANQYAEGGLKMGTTRNYSDVHGRTRELAWNFKWQANESWSFQNDLQWVHSTNRGDFGMINLGTFVPRMGVDVTGARPSFTFDDQTRAMLADPKSYFWDISQPDRNKAKADLYAWKVDGKYTFDSPVLRDFRFGMRITERGSRKDKNAGTGWKSFSEEWGVATTKVPGTLPLVADMGWQPRPNFGYLSDPRYAALGTVENFAFPNFFNGRMQAPPTIVVPTKDLIQNKPEAYKKLLTALVYNCQYGNQYKGSTGDCSTQGADWKPDMYSDEPQYVSKHNEGTQALHGTLRFGFDDWKVPVDGNVGVRVIRTNTTAHGYVVFKPTYGDNTNPSVPRFGTIDEPLDLKASHIDVIPSLNLKAAITDKLQGRLALSQGISRPGFDQLQEYITLSQDIKNDPSGKFVQMVDYTGKNDGNVHLKPLKANNFDVSLEWYPRPGQSLTAAFFYKKVKDIIMSETYTRTVKDLAGMEQDFTVTGPANAAKLHLRGIEIAGMTYLDKVPGLENLPDWVKGFGVSTNFTYIDGKQELYHPFKLPYCPAGKLSIGGALYGCDTNGTPFQDLPVPYMSRRAFNAAFMYDKGPVSARLAYSWRDRTLLATGVYGASGDNGTSSDPVRIKANGGVAPQDVGWGLPVWQEAVGQWDAGINYRFSDHMYGSFNVSNITNVVTKQTNQQTPGAMGRSWYDPGRSFRISMGYTF